MKNKLYSKFIELLNNFRKTDVQLFILTITVFALGNSLKAQNTFAIPDVNFATWLNTNIPSAMSGGNLLDTTNAMVTTRIRIDIENQSITNLNGIQYFTSLKTLDCGNNQITGLPSLPGTLDSLICGSNQLTGLPALPSALTVLKCYNNHISSLPTLPNTLMSLNCFANPITNLPSLPNTLIDLNCNQNYISSLPPLPSSLITLDCSSNGLSSLPALPNSLYSLNCGLDQLTSLPTLPTSLNTLICNTNSLTSLPTLPNSLVTLSCMSNQLITLPVLPPNLESLQCQTNSLTALPILPASLQALECNDNQLTNLPALPSVMYWLKCYNNQLTSLPNLPGALQRLECNNNLLTSLPALPGTLNYLYCGQNQLTSLPALPGSLYELLCQINQLTSLPALPNSLGWLACTNNNITCFPVFPSSIYNCQINLGGGNPFTCLPNYLPCMSAALLAYPLCQIGNSNGCNAAQGVVGFTYKDVNSNCTKDMSDQNLINIPMKFFDSGNNLLNQTYTALNGVYNFPDTAGTYSVLADTTGMPFTMQCVHPGIDSTLTVVSLDSNVNFSLTCKSGFDVGVQSVVSEGLVFPGQTHNLSIVAGDLSQWYNLNCASGISGSVQVTVTGPATYSGIGAGALTPTIAGNVYTYTIADFANIINTSAFNLLFTTNTSAQAGDSICVTINVTPGVDNNVSNNTYHFCYLVVNSHDPNIKEVYPVNVLPGYNDWFTYTIHFQNTGSAQAINIFLTDTLDVNLDTKTFQVINFSHPNTVSLTGNYLTVRFSNINLADSTTNLAGSRGFVQYRIKPKANLPMGTKIYNTANIYFDYNPAVVTNTTINEYAISTSVAKLGNSSAGVSVYPNPFSDNTTFAIKSDKNEVYSFEMVDVLGKTVISLNGISAKQFQISRNSLESGFYLYKIYCEGIIVGTGKVVIK